MWFTLSSWAFCAICDCLDVFSTNSEWLRWHSSKSEIKCLFFTSSWLDFSWISDTWEQNRTQFYFNHGQHMSRLNFFFAFPAAILSKNMKNIKIFMTFWTFLSCFENFDPTLRRRPRLVLKCCISRDTLHVCFNLALPHRTSVSLAAFISNDTMQRLPPLRKRFPTQIVLWDIPQI